MVFIIYDTYLSPVLPICHDSVTRGNAGKLVKSCPQICSSPEKILPQCVWLRACCVLVLNLLNCYGQQLIWIFYSPPTVIRNNKQ